MRRASRCRRGGRHPTWLGSVFVGYGCYSSIKFRIRWFDRGQTSDRKQVEPWLSMTSQVQRTGLPRTVLFVDVCGSTKLYETLGNARAQAIIGKTLDILSQ